MTVNAAQPGRFGPSRDFRVRNFLSGEDSLVHSRFWAIRGDPCHSATMNQNEVKKVLVY
jgi:hypothetical protein